MTNLPSVLAVLLIIGSILRASHCVTPEEAEAFCAIAPGSCSFCGNLCAKPVYSGLGKTLYSSGCGEYCNEKGGTISVIDFSHSRLKVLGAEVGRLANLTHLNLSHNSLEALPHSIGYISSLMSLDASNNNLESIPKGLASCSIKSLILSSNKLASLENLPRVTHFLDVSNNTLTEISLDTAKSLPPTLNIDYNYLSCSQYSSKSWSHIKESCNQSKQYASKHKHINGYIELESRSNTGTLESKQKIYKRDANDVKLLGNGDNKQEYNITANTIVCLVLYGAAIVTILVVCMTAICCHFIESMNKMRSRWKEGLLEENKISEEKEGWEENEDNCYDGYSPPEISLEVFASNHPDDSKELNEPISAEHSFTSVARAHMDISLKICEPTQPGLNSIRDLFVQSEFTKPRNLQAVLQQGGCDAIESRKINQEVISWAENKSCPPAFTATDLEVLGIYTFNYGVDYRLKSPAFKLCRTMNQWDEHEISKQKDFLCLTLAALRKLCLANYDGMKLYFALPFTDLLQESFFVGKEFKVMSFLTLFSNKNVVVNTLNSSKGVIFEVSFAVGYDISQYSIVGPGSFGTSEIIMEPESVFRVEGRKQISGAIEEVSLVYVREKSVFPLSDLIGSNSSNGDNSLL